ncbi:MAG: hypothetical protein FWE34_09085 [Defluviitaleaceae bacterium]|nr:hypothetical protein [Defluviitaleaceae bacterium]
MNRKDLFKIWAPTDSAELWTRFAKPSLFVHIGEFALPKGFIQAPHIPTDVTQLNNGKTAIIVDLPDVASVSTGLGLAKLGFRPIPMFNGIHETKIGGLSHIIDNAPIIDALVSGAEALRYQKINNDAPPAFLLDHNRLKEVHNSDGMFDNRWSIELEDMPDAAFMSASGIDRLIVWTQENMREDLIPVIHSYRDAGIEVLTFSDGKISYPENVAISQAVQTATIAATATTSKKEDVYVLISRRDNVGKFETARAGLFLITVMAFLNLFFMFLVWHEPAFWTTPSIMWMTYLWVSEAVGDVIAVAMAVSYLLLYILSQKRRWIMIVALAYFGIDLLVFYIYAFSYGLWAFTGHSALYGIIVFGLPIFFLTY